VDNLNNPDFLIEINGLSVQTNTYNPARLLYANLDNFLRRLAKRACSERLNTLCTEAPTRAYPQGHAVTDPDSSTITSRMGKRLHDACDQDPSKRMLSSVGARRSSCQQVQPDPEPWFGIPRGNSAHLRDLNRGIGPLRQLRVW
jgi:hypothetical protein